MTVQKESLHFLVLEDLSSPAAQAALKPLKADKVRRVVSRATALEELPSVAPFKLDLGHTDHFSMSDDLRSFEAPVMALHLWDEVD